MKNPLSFTNSEASEISLRLLAASPVATRLLEEGLFRESEQGKKVEKRSILYDTIGQTFTLASLVIFEKSHTLLFATVVIRASVQQITRFSYLPSCISGWRSCQKQGGVVIIYGAPWWTDVLCPQESSTNSKLGGCRAIWEGYSAQT